MLDHVSLGVRDLERAIAFCDAVTAPLGAVRLWRTAVAAGYGPDGGDDRLAIFLASGAAAAGEGIHLVLTAAEPAAVDQFHAAAAERTDRVERGWGLGAGLAGRERLLRRSAAGCQGATEVAMDGEAIRRRPSRPGLHPAPTRPTPGVSAALTDARPSPPRPVNAP